MTAPATVAGRGSLRGAALLAVVGALVTGTSSTLMQLSAATSTTAAFSRCAYAFPVLVLVALRERRRGRVLPWRDVPRAVCAGAFLAVDLIVWLPAIHDLGAGPTTVVQDTQVVFVALVTWAVLGQRPARRLVVLVPVLVGGTALVAGLPTGAATGADPLRGIALTLVSTAAYAGFLLLLGTRDGRNPAPGSFLAVVTLATGAAAFVVGGSTGSLHLAPTWPGAGWLVLLALGTQVFGWLVVSIAMTRVSRLQASVVLLVQPVAAVVAAWVLLGDALTGLQVVGVAVVVCGVAGVTVGVPRRAEPLGAGYSLTSADVHWVETPPPAEPLGAGHSPGLASTPVDLALLPADHVPLRR